MQPMSVSAVPAGQQAGVDLLTSKAPSRVLPGPKPPKKEY